MELSIDQLNARFGGAGQSGDVAALIDGALSGGGPVSSVVARSLACCLALAGRAHWRRFEIVGSLRRGQAWVGDLDLLVQGDLPALAQVYQALGLTRGMGGGGGRLALNAGELQVDFWGATDDEWGASLLELTGPTGYVIGLKQVALRQGMELSRHGLFRGPQRVAGRTEEEVYRALGKQWKAPHLRGI